LPGDRIPDSRLRGNDECGDLRQKRALHIRYAFPVKLSPMSFPNAVIGNPVLMETQRLSGSPLSRGLHYGRIYPDRRSTADMDFKADVRAIRLRHSRENGNPLEIISFRSRYGGKWIPAFAGMTGDFLSSTL
jgi:hypothetical protein